MDFVCYQNQSNFRHYISSLDVDIYRHRLLPLHTLHYIDIMSLLLHVALWLRLVVGIIWVPVCCISRMYMIISVFSFRNFSIRSYFRYCSLQKSCNWVFCMLLFFLNLLVSCPKALCMIVIFLCYMIDICNFLIKCRCYRSFFLLQHCNFHHMVLWRFDRLLFLYCVLWLFILVDFGILLCPLLIVYI